MSLSGITEIIEDIRQGKMIILMDDEARENEGDLIMAAQWVRPEDINFMARYGRGLICLTLSQAHCQQLKLPLMVNDTNDRHSTNFTVSIEAARGVTTGISAADRAVTIQAAVAAEARPEDLVQPGHVFPIMARPGGVLVRAGHTEAGCDLARLAGLRPAAAIVEILNDDGTMARYDDLVVFANQHDLKIGTIADLIDYRIKHEKNVEQVADCVFPTEFGEFRLVAFRENIEDQVHFAFVKGDIDASQPTLVRVHLRDDIGDFTEVLRGGLPMPLRKAFAVMSREETGVLVLLRRVESTDDLIKRIRQFKLQDEGAVLPVPDPVDDLRHYGIGAQILLNLGVRRMKVLGTPKKLSALSGFGLTIEEYVALEELI